MSSPTTVEMTHLVGDEQPLALMNIPQGTYTSATINAGTALVSFMNNSIVSQQTVTVGSQPVPFSSPMVVGSTPVVFNFDMNMAKSVSITAGNVTVNPAFTASMGTPGSGNPQDPENGAMHVIGSVASTSGSSFAISMMQSPQPMNFKTGSGTQFMSMGGMGMMGSNQIISVDAVMQPDGTMLANSVQFLMNAGGSMANGMADSITGTPATQFTMVAQNGTGSSMMPSALSNSVTADATGAAFSVDTDGVDMSGLPFTTAAFNSSTMSPAQRVEAISSGAMSGGGGMMGGGMMNAGTMAASMVQLVQQAMSGTVSNLLAGSAPATFTLTVPANSAFAILTGATTMTVYQQPGTEMRGLPGISNNAQVQVRGLLFHNSGAYQMVASRIMAP